MKKILISTSYTFGERENTVRIDNAYTGAVLSNGGLALSLPIESRKEKIDAYLDMADGVILTGGIDVSPMLYDSYSKTEMDFHEERDDFEGALFEGALERGLPILGICRGLQLVNVLRGGSLYQDLELSGFKEVRHSKKAEDSFIEEVYHYVDVEKDSLLYRIVGKQRLLVNSIHHQAIDRLGEGLRGVAKSSDGLVEAFEMPSYQKFLGLQFHPERLHQKEDYAKIFKSFLGGFND